MSNNIRNGGRAQSFSIQTSAPPAERVTDEPVTYKTAQSTVTCAYQTNIAGFWRNVTILWCKNIMNHSLSITVDSLDVDVFWDLRSAKFSGGPEPSADYYVALVSDEEVVLLLGDHKKKAYKRTKSRPALVDAIQFYKKENVFAKKCFSTRAKFEEKKKEHDIVVESSTSGPRDPEMWISIDGIVLIHVKNLQWKFRGNQTVLVDKLQVQVFWDVHDWLFSNPGTGHGLFIFKPGAPEADSDRDGDSSRGGDSDTSTGSSRYYNARAAAPEFSLLLYAWKID
ncbi:hypothetical protein CK203_017779 [Vitis vinifera]|uniref:DUF868 domain-containing protein n=1 Tax=Vitis vinifera TaxID=29760 RepID=A0A438JH12_VITVI|nr:hypothetical protein CK203_017779 [Vitis vinifera]